MEKPVRTRVAPSPTGYPHIGMIYQAMFDYILAHKYHGQFIVRIEDTDRTRFVEGAEKVIFDSLAWFGLNPAEDPIKGGEYGPYRQSERLAIYQEYVQKLIDTGHAYYCFCTKERLDQMRQDQQAKKQAPMYDQHCLNLSADEIEQQLRDNVPHVVRMKVPADETIVVYDSIVGAVEFDSNLIDHQVILKADGYPTYHLAVVVDDYLMKITHIIRGKEWLPSTPKHVLLYRFFGWEDAIPSFTHIPVILNSDGKGKLSKRDGHTSVDFYKQEGFLPEAILNYLSNIVWNHPDGIEIYPVSELEKAVDINSEKIIAITSVAPRFDLRKLEWMNGEYIRQLSDDELTKRLQEFLVDHPAKDRIAPIVPLIKERIKKLSDFIPLTNFLFQKPEYDIAVFNKLKIEDMTKSLERSYETINQMDWNAEAFEQSFRSLAESLDISVKDMFQLIRICVAGQLVTPPLFESMDYLGKDEVLHRIDHVRNNYPDFIYSDTQTS